MRIIEVFHDDQFHPYQYSRSAHLFPDCPLWMSSLYIAFCGQTKHVLLLSVCLAPTALTSWSYPRTWVSSPSQRQCLAGMDGTVIVGHHLLPDRLTAQRCHDFLEIIPLRLRKCEPLAVRQTLLFQHVGASAHYIWQWFNATGYKRTHWRNICCHFVG